MKILHLISSSGLLGAERVLLELAEHSRRAGLKVSIGVFENNQNPNLDLAQYARAMDFDVQIFPCNGRWDNHTVQTIEDYMVNNGIQVLHSHNYKSNFYAWKSLSNNNVKWVVTNHGRRSSPKLTLYNFLDGFVVRHADRVVAVSRKIARKMRFAGIAQGKILLIENGIDLERFTNNAPPEAIKESLGIEKDALVVGTIGALTKEKGHQYLLRAVLKVIRIYPQAIFLLVGDGIERPSLEKTVSSLGIKDSVIFAGMRKDVPKILSIFDVFVLPSLNEGLPMALLEAQGAQIPVIASYVGAIPDVLQDGVTGVLIPPKDPQAIAEAIIMILSDKQLASRIAKKGFERVRDNFSAERMARKYLSLYYELLSSVN